MRAGGDRPWSNDGTLCGIYYAIVCHNKDPDNLDRIKIRLPWLDHGDVDQTHWAQLVTPMEGKKFGWYTLPDIDDVVVVMFIGGDASQPVILGGVWSKPDFSPEPNEDGKNNFRGYRSRSGHRLILDDRSKVKVVFADKTTKNMVGIGNFAKDGAGPNVCAVYKPPMSGDVGVSFSSMAGTLEITCKDGALKIEAGQNVKINAKTTIDIKAGVVSGIGCTGRVAGYVRLDSFHTTHGRAIPVATGLKLGNPKLKVVVFSGDGDIIAIGGNHFINAARRDIDITVICVNNFNYAMTGGQVAATTPEGSILSTSPFGNYEFPFNLPFLAESVGAVYVARWTSLHVYNQTNAMIEAMKKPGFSFIEIIAPCPTIFERQQKMGDGLDRLRWYCENSEIHTDPKTKDADIRLRDRIVVGKFGGGEIGKLAFEFQPEFAKFAATEP